MENLVTSGFKLGIIGGGQLGKMLVQSAHQWDVTTHIFDPSKSCPASKVCNHVTQGGFNDYEAIVNFGEQVDIITCELENVNIEALCELKKRGKVIHPDPEGFAIIQDKGLQKDFYAESGIPTAPYRHVSDKAELLAAISSGTVTYPFIQKSRIGGYDGRGVQLVRSEHDHDLLFDCPSIVEDLVDIKKEIAVIAAKGSDGDIKCFSPVEMIFNKENMVEKLICPSELSETQIAEAESLALKIVEKLNVRGLLAVEMFEDRQGNIIVNETAPRPHNSGHHTIESCFTSQYEQHLRSVLGMPLGSTEIKCAAVMINILGDPSASGEVKYEGLTEAMALPGANIHIYGKTSVKPFRKMGHATVIADDIKTATEIADKLRNNIKVLSK